MRRLCLFLLLGCLSIGPVLQAQTESKPLKRKIEVNPKVISYSRLPKKPPSLIGIGIDLT